MDMLCAFTELLLMTNPRIVEQRNAQPIEGRVLVLKLDFCTLKIEYPNGFAGRI